MRKKLILIAALAIFLAGIVKAALNAWENQWVLLQVKTPPPNLVLLMDASEDLVNKREICNGCWEIKRVTEHVSRTYTYPVPDNTVDPNPYIQRAISEFTQWVQDNYKNPEINNITTSYRFKNGAVQTYIYASTAKAGSIVLVKEQNPSGVTGPFPKVWSGANSAPQLENYTHFPVTTWQAYYDYYIRPSSQNAGNQYPTEYYYEYGTPKPQPFFRPTQYNKAQSVSVRLANCVARPNPSRPSSWHCQIQRLFYKSNNCTGPSTANFGPSALRTVAANIFPASRATSYINTIKNKIQEKYGWVNTLGPVEKNFSRAALTLSYSFDTMTTYGRARGGGQSLCSAAGGCGVIEKAIDVPNIWGDLTPPDGKCIGADSMNLNLIVWPEASDSTNVDTNQGTKTVRFAWFYRQKVSFPGAWKIEVTVEADVTYDKKVWNDCCTVTVIKDKSEFYKFRDAVKDWVLANRDKARIWVFVSGGKEDTGSVLLVNPDMNDAQVSAAFAALQPYGPFAYALSAAELDGFFDGSVSISRMEGAPPSEMGIPPSPSRYSDPFLGWCHRNDIIALVSGADASNRSNSSYGELQNRDYDKDNGGGSEQWNKMGDDLSWKYFTEDLRPDLPYEQEAGTSVIAYKYGDPDGYYRRVAKNGGGVFLGASDPQQLIKALDSILENYSSASICRYEEREVPFDPVVLKASLSFKYGLELNSIPGFPALHQGILKGFPIDQEGTNWSYSRWDAVANARLEGSRPINILMSDGSLIPPEGLEDAFYERYGWSKAEFLQFLESYKSMLGFGDILYRPEISYPVSRFSSDIPPTSSYFKERQSRYAIFVADNVGAHAVDYKTGRELWMVIPEEEIAALKSFATSSYPLQEVFTGKVLERDEKIGPDSESYQHWVFFHSQGARKIYGFAVDDTRRFAIRDSRSFPAPAYFTDYQAFRVGDSEKLAVAGDSVVLYDVGTGAPQWVVRLQQGERAFSLVGLDTTLDGNKDFVIVATSAGRILQIEAGTGLSKEILVGAPGFYVPLILGGDGRRSLILIGLTSCYKCSDEPGYLVVLKFNPYQVERVDFNDLPTRKFGETIDEETYISRDFKGYKVPLGQYKPIPRQAPDYINFTYYAAVARDKEAVYYCDLPYEVRLIAFHPVNNTVVSSLHMSPVGIRFKVIRRFGSSRQVNSGIISSFPSPQQKQIKPLPFMQILYKVVYKGIHNSGVRPNKKEKK